MATKKNPKLGTQLNAKQLASLERQHVQMQAKETAKLQALADKGAAARKAGLRGR